LDFGDIMAEGTAMTDNGKLAESAQMCDLLLQVQGRDMLLTWQLFAS
jgi:hypothetical protein